MKLNVVVIRFEQPMTEEAGLFTRLMLVALLIQSFIDHSSKSWVIIDRQLIKFIP